MPQYEYKCNKCGYIVVHDETDLLVYATHFPGGDPEATEERMERNWKTLCNGKFKRVYSFGGAILKGDGWSRSGLRR